ncbi:Magnesium transport, transmembrane region [Lecanosticta acicola]|uniref:Magnesium transport, transmembrane region n=1 Tax=Lecanosticta acicola TaxID=111012 RepID=A0AAI8YV41_9PEZI|nr:Magnesium transport, transmembrane region [Lecanosticta acicola]
MLLQRAEEEYICRLIKHSKTTQSSFCESNHGFQQRVFYLGLDLQNPDLGAVLRQHEEDEATGRRSICVVENISPEWVGTLGVAWNIEQDFFLQHAFNSNTGGDLWNAVMGPQAREEAWISSVVWVGLSRRGSDVQIGRQHYFIEGMLRHTGRDYTSSNRIQRLSQHGGEKYGEQINTKISYCRVSNHSYLFLVDAPFMLEASENLPLIGLRVPYSQNRSGLCIPQTFEKKAYFSTFESLRTAFSLGWSLKGMFAGDHAIDYVAFSYFLATRMWVINLRFLDRDIKSIAFKDVRRPSVRINDILHNRRRDLDHLRSEVSKTKTWISPELEQFSEDLHDTRSRSPKAALEGVYEESGNLERFLMDTFQLLMSSISVLDSQTSIKEARRSALLTQLATVYLPLSLVTSIFGMNVREISDPIPSIWVCVVTLVIVGGFTAALLWLSRTYQEAHWVENLSGLDRKISSGKAWISSLRSRGVARGVSKEKGGTQV